MYDHLKENNQTCEKEATIRKGGIASSGDDVQPAKEQHRRTFLTYCRQVLEARNCLHCQYRVVVDRVQRMARVMELEKSFWEKETANVDGSKMLCCLYLVCQIFQSYSLE